MSLSRDWRRYGMVRVAGCSAICRKASSSRSVSFGGRIWSIRRICAYGPHDQAGFVRPDDDSEGVARSFLGNGKGGFSSSERSSSIMHPSKSSHASTSPQGGESSNQQARKPNPHQRFSQARGKPIRSSRPPAQLPVLSQRGEISLAKVLVNQPKNES